MKMRTGFLAFEMLIGLALLVSTAALIAVAAGRHSAATHRLADSRAAVRLAEEAMTALQVGEKLPESRDATVSVERLQDPSPVPGCRWARVTANVCGRSAELVGLVRSENP